MLAKNVTNTQRSQTACHCLLSGLSSYSLSRNGYGDDGDGDDDIETTSSNICANDGDFLVLRDKLRTS